MSDWPALFDQLAGGVIHTGSGSCFARDCQPQSNFSAGAVWPSASLACYIPFMVETTVTAYQMAFEVTTQSGNYDIGLYDVLKNRLVSKGSTAVPAAGIATADITDTVLTPGIYFMALNIDNTTAAVTRIGTPAALLLEVTGVQQQAVGAVTLPDPAVFANPATFNNYLPLVAVALSATI